MTDRQTKQVSALLVIGMLLALIVACLCTTGCANLAPHHWTCTCSTYPVARFDCKEHVCKPSPHPRNRPTDTAPFAEAKPPEAPLAVVLSRAGSGAGIIFRDADEIELVKKTFGDNPKFEVYPLDGGDSSTRVWGTICK